MIGTIQKERITGKLLQQIYMHGRTPTLAEIRRKLADVFAGKIVGLPLFEPRLVASSQIVDPDLLTANAVEIKEDLDTLKDWINETLENEAVLFGAFDTELTTIGNKLEKQSAELQNILLQEYHLSKNGITDSFKDSSKIDLQNSTVLINNQIGFVSLPLSSVATVRYPVTNTQLVEEKFAGATSLGFSFMNALTDYADQTWQVDLKTGGSYSVMLNITGLPVIAGHDNEIEINRITITPIGTFSLTIEASVDNMNWQTIATRTISNYTVFDFDPTWVLFLRFTIAGNGVVGIKHMDVWKIHTAEKATLFSTAHTLSNNVSSFLFSAEGDIPHGTNIKHFIRLGDTAAWTQIEPGVVNISNLVVNTVAISGLVYDPVSMLYNYNIDDVNILDESGEMLRGLNQFYVRSFSFNWTLLGDSYHVPKLDDFDGTHGIVHSAYMSPLPTCYYPDVMPTELPASTSSFIVNYVGDNTKWWGIGITSASGMVLTPESSYCITTYLYSDRDIYIENAGGGLYVISSDPALANMRFVGWSLYLNNGMLVSSNITCAVNNIPDMEVLTSSNGQTFPLSLRRGWNRIDLLVYVPEDTLLNSTLKTTQVVLYLRPSIIDYKPDSDLLWEKLPAQTSYPIWADGKALTRVSSFYLKWNVPPADSSYWAWRINENTQKIDGLLLNNDPSTVVNTIDGKFCGNPYSLTLRYSVDVGGTQSLYYRADLERGKNILSSPRLYSYSIIPLVGA